MVLAGAEQISSEGLEETEIVKIETNRSWRPRALKERTRFIQNRLRLLEFAQERQHAAQPRERDTKTQCITELAVKLGRSLEGRPRLGRRLVFDSPQPK